jgi:alkylated DNA repair dioxygenase AlkB
VVARRRIAHFGWLYRFDSREVAPGPAIPQFLEPVRERLAAYASVSPEDLGEALVTEYPPGAGIGWHRDAPPFGIVAAVSLAGPCRFRFQRGEGGGRQTSELVLEPRSAYVLAGPARIQWQHHIPPTKTLRYSVTFRTLRTRRA